MALLTGPIASRSRGGDACGAFAVTPWLGIDDPLDRSSLVFGALALVSGVFFFLSWQKYVRYDAGGYWLEFFASVPSKEAIEAFVAKIQGRRRQYLSDRTGDPMSGDSPVDQVARLHSLRKEGAISDEEFERLKADIVGRVGQTQSTVGPQSSEKDSG